MSRDSFYETEFNTCSFCEDLILSKDGQLWTHIDSSREDHDPEPRTGFVSVTMPQTKHSALISCLEEMPWWLLPVAALVFAVGLIVAVIIVAVIVGNMS